MPEASVAGSRNWANRFVCSFGALGGVLRGYGTGVIGGAPLFIEEDAGACAVGSGRCCGGLVGSGLF